MRHSCGAILYAYDTNGDLGIILGKERTHWLPFKGRCEENETFEEAAIREIYEETCKLVKLDTIELKHKFTTKHKHYHIGLCLVDYDIIKTFHIRRKMETESRYREKQTIKFFLLSELHNCSIHSISRASVDYFWNQLVMLKKKVPYKYKKRRRSTLLRQPRKFSSTYTKEMERKNDMQRTWRC